MRNDPRFTISRRSALKLGAVSTVAGALGCAGLGSDDASSSASLQTPLCDLLGIRYPILQAPMARVVTPEMVAAVADAGGLGIVAGTGVAPDALRAQIRRIRELTDRPFGVNLVLHPSVMSPPAAESVTVATMQAIQGVLNRFRRQLGIPAGALTAPTVPDLVGEAFEVILDERVPVFSVGVGKPTAEMVTRCRAQDTKVVCMVSTVPDAVEVAALGADVIIAQGGEAGGHRSTWAKRPSAEMATIGVMTLLPQVVDAVGVPVVAAGGITEGRQVAAALALGASGVLMGTRFIATRESAAPEFYKRALVEHDSDATTITDAFTGLHARVIRTMFTEQYAASGAPVIPVLQQAIVGDIAAASAQAATGDFYPMYAGQGTGMIRDVPGAGAVVEMVTTEASRVMADLAARARS